MLDKLAMWLAWRLPRRVAYWCTIRVGAHAAGPQYASQLVPDLTVTEALNRWTGGAEMALPTIDERARASLDRIYTIVTAGDAPALDDLEHAAMVDPLNMARRYAAIVEAVTT